MDVLDRLRLDVPIAQAGMGGGLAGGDLAGAVASAGGLGTIGLAPPTRLREAIAQVRDQAPDRAVAVNLLMPFVRRAHVQACLGSGVDVTVLAFGRDKTTRTLMAQLRDAGVFVFVMVGTATAARNALAWGADGLIAQGREAGGHLVGIEAALDCVPKVLAVSGNTPVFLAGGIATADDTRAALAVGAAGVVAGTRFLMTHESAAHRGYLARIAEADRTVETTLFGLSWPLRHRVVPNAATRRWCHADGRAKALPTALNRFSGPLARLPDSGADSMVRLQRPNLPVFTPVAATVEMPESVLDNTALYAGETARRIADVISAHEALARLSP